MKLVMAAMVAQHRVMVIVRTEMMMVMVVRIVRWCCGCWRWCCCGDYIGDNGVGHPGGVGGGGGWWE